ncbi:hypothetical protein T06_5407 [Trichinella sp. T6]|nr:hypothetical protein T06_5407 [Trichinella sp. T6]
MKLVPFATRVRMDVKAFLSRPSVPLLITNSQIRNSILFMTAMKYSQAKELSNCVSYCSDVFPCHARGICVTVKTTRILNDLHRITIIKSSRDLVA